MLKLALGFSAFFFSFISYALKQIKKTGERERERERELKKLEQTTQLVEFTQRSKNFDSREPKFSSILLSFRVKYKTLRI
mgnify:CR=1 FL=1